MRPRTTLLLAVSSLVSALAPTLPGQNEPVPPTAADVTAFGNWIDAWMQGQVVLVKQGRLDRRADRKFRELFKRIAGGQDIAAAKRLWQAATMQLPEGIDKHRRLAASAGRVTGLARKLIATIDAPGVDEWLVAIASRKGGAAGSRTRLVAIEIMGLRERPETGKLLAAKLNTFPIPERIQAVLALERTGSLEVLPVLLKLLKQREPNLRIAVVQAVSGILGPYSDQTRDVNVGVNAEGHKWTPIVVNAFQKTLNREKVWQVRAAICEGLLRLKHRLAIPVLIKGLEKELGLGKWSNQMVAILFHETLEQMTGRSLPENSPDLWKDFWKKEGAKFKYATVEQQKGGKPVTSTNYAKYFNLEIKTKRLLFIIDFSGSMNEKVNLQGRYSGAGSRHVKYQLVKKELEKVIRALPKDATCNVVFFNDRISVWRRDKSGKPKLVKMGDDNKSDLLQYVWETSPGGATNLYGALKAALAIGDRGVYDKYYGAAYDSVFLLSDGAPTAGETTDTTEILQRVHKANKLKRLRVHTIVFGDSRNNLKFMQALAEQNNGKFMHVK